MANNEVGICHDCGDEALLILQDDLSTGLCDKCNNVESAQQRLDAVIAHIYWRLSSDNTGENYKDDNSYYSTHEMHCIRRELRRILTIAKGETK